MKLPDNRQFCWFESGPKTGFPVIFCTGAGMSGSLGFGLDLLEKLNIRLIVPERAGLGESTFHPEKSLKSFAMDVQALLNEQSITRFSVVGFSQGAVFAMALCVYCHVDKLLIVAGQDQFDYPDTQKKLTEDVINMQRQAVGTPDLLTSWIKQNITAKWLMDFILNYSADVDLAFITQLIFSLFI
ncbi:alpha/beta hydrolase, partial [Escherichia coli]